MHVDVRVRDEFGRCRHGVVGAFSGWLAESNGRSRQSLMLRSLRRTSKRAGLQSSPKGERFLASFAIPGVPAGQRNTTEAEVGAALSRKVEAKPDDGIEARQMKAMVEGMKDELRRFVSAGGAIAAYGRKLVRRQEEEISYYNRAKAEIEKARKSKMPAAQLNDLWEKRNESLRQMGVKLVPMPE